MRVGLLGPVSLRHGDSRVALGGLKQRAVFALLALSANRVVSMDRLVGEIWPEEPPAQATVALRSYISRLRRLLTDTEVVIETRPPGWVMRIEADQIDAVRFGRLITDGRRLAEQSDESGRAREWLTEALALASGDPLADLRAFEFARVEAARFDELRQEAGELLLEARLAAGEHAGVIETARQFVVAHPYRERAWSALMVALYRSGRQTDALAAYAELTRLLRDELGLDPSPEVRDLNLRILRQHPELRAPVRPQSAMPAPRAEPTPDTIEGRLEGRVDTLATFDELWRRAEGGSGRLVLVEATAGAGKSVILQAVTDRVRASGGRVLTGNGVGDDAIPALWPWVTIVRDLLAAIPGFAAGAAPSGSAALAVSTLGAGSGSDLAEDTQLAQTALYRGVVDLLLAARRSGPLAVVVDDLQWVDRDSLTLLGLAVDQVAPAGVLFVVAVRRDEANVAAIARMIDTLRRDHVTRIDLRPLGLSEVGALTERLAGRSVEPGLVAAIAERTSGNPLFVAELVRLLVAEGQLTESAARRALPSGVRDVLQRRIDRLPKETVGLLGVAALTGPSLLDVDLLAEVTGLAEEEVLDGCESALLSGLLVENTDTPGTFGLSHDLVRQTLIAGLSQARRVRWHAKIADALQRRPVGSPEQIVEIARQLTLAAPAVGPAAAIPYLISASEDARSRYANESAEATLKSALVVAGSIADERQRHAMQMQVQGLLAGLQTLARGARPDVYALAAGPQLPHPTDPHSAAGWLGVVINVTVSGRYDWGIAAARQVLARSPIRSAEIAARFTLGWLSYVRGDLETGIAELSTLEEMVDGGTDIALPGALTHLAETVAGYLALIAHVQGDDERASEQLAVARRRAAGSDSALLNVVLYDSLLAALRGDRAAAAHHAAESRRLSGRTEYPVYAIVTDVVGAWSRSLTGESGQTIDEAYAAYQGIGIRYHEPTFLLLRAEVREALGDRVGAAELARESRRTSLRFGEVCLSPRLLALAERLLADPAATTPYVEQRTST